MDVATARNWRLNAWQCDVGKWNKKSLSDMKYDDKWTLSNFDIEKL